MADYIAYAELDDEQKLLVDNPDSEMRCKAAKRGWGLDKLVKDENDTVRWVIAKSGAFLSELVNDKSLHIVRTVIEGAIEHGCDLMPLVGHKDVNYREQAAAHGWGLDVLVHDDNQRVFTAAWRYLVVNDLSMSDWIAANPEKCALEENRISHDDFSEITKQGYRVLERFENKHGEIDVLAYKEKFPGWQHPVEYAIGHAYHVDSGEWRSGEYFCTMEDAGREWNKLTAPEQDKVHESGLVGISKDALVMEVPDGYLVAETCGVMGDYPGISLSFYDPKLEMAIDVALLEHSDVVRGRDGDGYVLSAYPFGDEECYTAEVFDADDIADLEREVEAQWKLAAKYEQSVAVNAARGERGGGRGHGDDAR